MRLRTWFLMIALLAAAGCGRSVTIVPSGEVVTEVLELGPFDRMQVDSAFIVNVTPGSSNEVTLRVNENIMDRVRAEVEGDTLVIGLRPGFSVGSATLEATVTATSLSGVDANGASTVVLREGFAAEEFGTAATGASRVEGEIDAGRLQASASGASTLSLSGQAEQAALEASGASELALADLNCEIVDVRLSGASTADVNAASELSYTVSGASRLTYAGGPEITSQDVSGASSVEGG